MLVDDRSNDLPFLIALGGAWIGGPNPDWDQAISLIRAIAIADDEEIERWAKFAAADDPLAEQAVARTRAEAIEQFEALSRELGKTAERNDGDMRRFNALLHAARVIELVDDERTSSWMDEFLIREARPDEPMGTFIGSYGGLGSDIGRVVRSIAPPIQRKRGLRIDAIEIYDGGLVIRWQHLRPERNYSGSLTWPADEIECVLSQQPDLIAVSDDRGTDFSFGLGGSGGSRSDDGSALSFGISIFEVRPDAKAGTLYIDAGESRFEVDLRDSHE